MWTTIISLIAGGGSAFAIWKFVFFQVEPTERAIIVRLGKPLLRKEKAPRKTLRIKLPGQRRHGKTLTVTLLRRPFKKDETRVGKLWFLSPGHFATVIPFWHKVKKINVAIRTKNTVSIEMMRFDPEWKEEQAWMCEAKINYRVQTSRERVRRAVIRADDLNETAVGHVESAIRHVMQHNHVGTMETSGQIFEEVRKLCKRDFDKLGLALTKVNVYKLVPKDAQIMGNSIRKMSATGDIDATTVAAIVAAVRESAE
jgi:hypothetical protein